MNHSTEQLDPVRAPSPDQPDGTRSGVHWAASIMPIVERFGLLILLVAVVVFFAVYPATSQIFPTTANFKNIAANEAVLIVVALAVLVPMVAHRFDLSAGAVVALASIAAAKATTSMELPLAVGVVVGIGVGLVVGLVNGALIAYCRANSLVITLGMSTLLIGAGAYWSGYQTLVGVPQSLTSFGSEFWLNVPKSVWLVVCVALGVSYLLGMTVHGRRLLSIGSNESAANLVGMPVQRTVMIAFAVSGGLAGLAGVLLLARTGSAASGVGTGYLLPALAAIFLGSTTIRPGRFTVAGTLTGVFFVAVSINGLTLAGTEDWVEPVFNGGAVIVAVAISSLLTHRRLTGSPRR
ncbi:ABC transporter permease [Micromonospora sp. CPCC 206060]|uniref:ABC transporter permease n=1 Tax=Micromonospora sp. CPCC 206060 TaxID=3122406 RepID=UPI002FF32A3C